MDGFDAQAIGYVAPSLAKGWALKPGALGPVFGAGLAGLMIGVSESMFVALFPDPSRSLTYAQAFSLLILMLVLLIRPTGLFGRAHAAME